MTVIYVQCGSCLAIGARGEKDLLTEPDCRNCSGKMIEISRNTTTNEYNLCLYHSSVPLEKGNWNEDYGRSRNKQVKGLPLMRCTPRKSSKKSKAQSLSTEKPK